MNKDEILKLQNYLRKTFNNKLLSVRARPKKEDSAEVFIGDEFVAVVFRDEEDDGYQFQMAILDMDLEEA